MGRIFLEFKNEVMSPFNENLLKLFIIVIFINLAFVIIRFYCFIISSFIYDKKLSKVKYENYVGSWFTKEEIEKALGDSYEKMQIRSSQKNKFKI